jgi:hypothetical protein
MQDEIVARLANALNTQLLTAEARRAERAPSRRMLVASNHDLANSVAADNAGSGPMR